jgi:hypothetical protein
MASKLTWKDFYKSLELEKGVAGVEGVTGRIAGSGDYDGPLATKYKKELPDFSTVKKGDNYPSAVNTYPTGVSKVPNQAHPDDEDALGMMAAPEVDSFSPHNVEKIKTLRSPGKFAEATKHLSNKQFVKVLLEQNNKRPSPKAISDLHGHKFTPQPYEVISYLVSLCHNQEIISRLVGELKKNGHMEDLVQELIERPDFYKCIVKCMDHEENGPKIANRMAKSMADHHLNVVKNNDVMEAVSPALVDDLPPEDDDNELNASPQEQPEGEEGEEQPDGEQPEGEENVDGEEQPEEEGDDKEGEDEEEGDGEEEEDTLELSDEEEDSLPNDDGRTPEVKAESLKHRKHKKHKRKLPHHHMMDALRPYFGHSVGLIGGYHHDHDDDGMPPISMDGDGGSDSGGV